MAQIPHVQPGEVIRSSVINGLIDVVNGIGTGVPVTGVPVPNAIGRSATRFFAGLTYRGPAFINGARLAHVIRESTDYPPIDTESDEFIWLYRVRENRMAIEFRSATPQPR